MTPVDQAIVDHWSMVTLIWLRAISDLLANPGNPQLIRILTL